MNIVGKIVSVGTPREFTTTQNGLEKKQKAVEVQISSGQNEILADFYGDAVDFLCEHARTGQLVIADMVFSVKEADRRDGSGKVKFMKATLTGVTMV